MSEATPPPPPRDIFWMQRDLQNRFPGLEFEIETTGLEYPPPDGTPTYYGCTVSADVHLALGDLSSSVLFGTAVVLSFTETEVSVLHDKTLTACVALQKLFGDAHPSWNTENADRPTTAGEIAYLERSRVVFANHPPHQRRIIDFCATHLDHPFPAISMLEDLDDMSKGEAASLLLAALNWVEAQGPIKQPVAEGWARLRAFLEFKYSNRLKLPRTPTPLGMRPWSTEWKGVPPTIPIEMLQAANPQAYEPLKWLAEWLDLFERDYQVDPPTEPTPVPDLLRLAQSFLDLLYD